MAQVLPSAARTATVTGVLKGWNVNAPRSFMLLIDTTAFTGGQTVTPSIELWDSTSSTWIEFAQMVAVSATGETIYIVREGEASAAGNVTDVFTRNIPGVDQVRLKMTHSDASSHTYSVAVYWYPPA